MAFGVMCRRMTGFFVFFMDVVVGPGRMRLPAAHPRPV